MLIPRAIASLPTDVLKAELERITATQDPHGPLFGSGGHNYDSAAKMLRAELARRAPATPAAPPAPAAPALSDQERAGYARDLFALGKSKAHIGATFGVTPETVDRWLNGQDDDGKDTEQAGQDTGRIDPQRRVDQLNEQLRQQFAAAGPAGK